MPKISKEKEEEDPHRHYSWHPDSTTLAKYRDDELSDKEKNRVQEHVSGCMPCRTEFFGICGQL